MVNLCCSTLARQVDWDLPTIIVGKDQQSNMSYLGPAFVQEVIYLV